MRWPQTLLFWPKVYFVEQKFVFVCREVAAKRLCFCKNSFVDFYWSQYKNKFYKVIK